jgi:hypothetical protein
MHVYWLLLLFLLHDNIISNALLLNEALFRILFIKDGDACCCFDYMMMMSLCCCLFIPLNLPRLPMFVLVWLLADVIW